LDLLESLKQKNVRARQRVKQNDTEELDWATLGYTIHNIYQSDLDPNRVELVQRQLDPTVAAFKEAHKEFLKKLHTIAAQSDD
jgi:hypothetical protein